VYRRFSITVVREFNEPFDSLYIKAMPPLADRALIDSLVTSQTMIPIDLVYRSDDPNFGVARSVIYNHAYGLSPASMDDYARSLDLNHYWKNLTLGEVKTAQALDANGNILYEVVYSQVIDNLVNNEGVSVGKSVDLPYTVDGYINEVYPNSLDNMRDQVIDRIGQISPALPLWMTSKQANGQVLGFVPAWVIAYTKPGYGGQVVYNIQQTFGARLNIIDFKADRYELNRSQSYNWDPETNQWIPHPPEATTFDIEAHYQLPVPNDSSFVFDGGIGYAVNDRIGILGSQVGGIDGTNDVVIVVTEVDESGTILTAYATGLAPILTVGDIYTNIAGTNITGSGSGATWDLITVGADTTIFDGNSTRFIAPAEQNSSTDMWDKYLLYPKTNILGR